MDQRINTLHPSVIAAPIVAVPVVATSVAAAPIVAVPVVATRVTCLLKKKSLKKIRIFDQIVSSVSGVIASILSSIFASSLIAPKSNSIYLLSSSKLYTQPY